MNTWDQLVEAEKLGIIKNKQAIAIAYIPGVRRGISYGRWQVFSPFFSTDKEAARFDNGYKTFNVLGRAEMTTQFESARNWAMAKYGVKEFKRNRMRDYVPAEVQDKLPIPLPEKPTRKEKK
jgi:hypothetical protein